MVDQKPLGLLSSQSYCRKVEWLNQFHEKKTVWFCQYLSLIALTILKDKEIIMEAVKNLPEALKYIHQSLKNDPDILNIKKLVTEIKK